MNTDVLNINYTPNQDKPVIGTTDFVNPSKIKEQLQTQIAAPEERSFADSYKRLQLSNRNKAETSPALFNRDLYKRYTDTFFGKSLFLDPRYYNNEEINAQRQKGISQLINGGVIKMGGNALMGFGAFFTTAPWKYDTEGNKKLAEWRENMEVLFPNYRTQAELDSKNPLKGFIPFTEGSANFWGDLFLKNVGYTVGSMLGGLVTATAVSYATGMTGAVPAWAYAAARTGQAFKSIGKAFTAANVMGRAALAGKQGQIGLQTATSINTAIQTWRNLSNAQKAISTAQALVVSGWGAGAEAGIEGMEGMLSNYQDMLNTFREENGRVPTAQEDAVMKQIAKESADIRFATNLALIWGTNYIQFGSLLKPFRALTTGQLDNTFVTGGTKSLGKRQFLDEAMQLQVKPETLLQRYARRLGGTELAVDGISEGMQEMFQYGIEEGTKIYSEASYKNFIEGKYDANRRLFNGDYAMAQIEGMKEAFTSKEGWQGFFLGFMTGYPIYGVKQGWRKFRKQPSFSEMENKAVTQFNSVTPDQLFQTQSFIEALKRDVRYADEKNQQSFLEEQMSQAIESGDIYQYKTLQHDTLVNMVRTAVAVDKFDARLVQLEMLGQLDDAAFTETFGLEANDKNKADIKKYIENVKQEAENIKEIVESVDQGWLNPFDFRTDTENWKGFEDVKDLFIRNASLVRNINNRLPEVVQQVLALRPEITTEVIDMLTNPEFAKTAGRPQRELIIKDIVNTKQQIESLKKSREAANKDNIPFTEGAELSRLEKKLSALHLYQKQVEKIFEGFNEQFEQILEEDLVNVKSQKLDNFRAFIKDLTGAILDYRIAEAKANNFLDNTQPYTTQQLEDIVTGIVDVKRLRDALDTVVDENNNLRTKEGQKQKIQEFVRLQKALENSVLNTMKKASFKELAKNANENVDAQKQEIAENEDQIQRLQSILEDDSRELSEEQRQEIQEEIAELEAQNKAKRKLIEQLEQGKTELSEEDLKEEEGEEEAPQEEEKQGQQSAPTSSEIPGVEVLEPVLDQTLEDNDVQTFLQDFDALNENSEHGGGLSAPFKVTYYSYEKTTYYDQTDGTIRSELFANFMNSFGTKDPHTKFQEWLLANGLTVAVRNIPQTDEFYDGTYFAPKFKDLKGQAIFIVDKNTLQPVKIEFKKNTWGVATDPKSSGSTYMLQTFPEMEKRTPLEVAKSYVWVNRKLFGLENPSEALIEQVAIEEGIVEGMEVEQERNKAIRTYFNELSAEDENTEKGALIVELQGVSPGTLPFVEKVSKTQRDKGFKLEDIKSLQDLFATGTLMFSLPVTTGSSKGISTKAGRLYLEVVDNRRKAKTSEEKQDNEELKKRTKVSSTISGVPIITIPVMMSELSETTVPISPTKTKNSIENLSEIITLFAMHQGKSLEELEGVLNPQMTKDFNQFISDSLYTGRQIKVDKDTEVSIRVQFEFSEIDGKAIFTPKVYVKRTTGGKVSSSVFITTNKKSGKPEIRLTTGGKETVLTLDENLDFNSISSQVQKTLGASLAKVRNNVALSYDSFTAIKDAANRPRLPIATVKTVGDKVVLDVKRLINDDFLQSNASNLNQAVRKLYFEQYLVENYKPSIPLKLNLDATSGKPIQKVGRAILFKFPEVKSKTPTISSTESTEVQPEVGQTQSPSVQDDIKAKKADIERRRQKELKERVVYDRKPTVEDGEFKIIGDPNNRVFRVNENTGRPQVLDESNGLWSNTEESPNLFFEIVSRSGFQKSKDKINAKYDAELKALEQQESSPESSSPVVNNIGIDLDSQITINEADGGSRFVSGNNTQGIADPRLISASGVKDRANKIAEYQENGVVVYEIERDGETYLVAQVGYDTFGGRTGSAQAFIKKQDNLPSNINDILIEKAAQQWLSNDGFQIDNDQNKSSAYLGKEAKKQIEKVLADIEARKQTKQAVLQKETPALVQETPVVETPSSTEVTPEGFTTPEETLAAFGGKPKASSNNLEQTKDNSSLAPKADTKKIRPNRANIDVPDLGNLDKLLSAKKKPRIIAAKPTQEQIDKIKSIFGSKGDQVNIEQLYDVVNQGAWATWSPAAITLYHGANSSDLYHEAWHHFSQLYLTPEEKIKLYEDIRKKEVSLKDASDKDVEEFAAREFSKYAISDGNYDLSRFSETKSIFKKIWEFLKSLFGQNKVIVLPQLFQNLYSGNIQDFNYSTDNILYSVLNSGINENFSSKEAALIKAKLDGVIASVLRINKLPLSILKNPSFPFDTIYLAAQKVIQDEEASYYDNNEVVYEGYENIAETLDKILNSFDDVKRYHFQTSLLLADANQVFELNEDGELISKEDLGDKEKEDATNTGRNAAEYGEATLQSFYDKASPEVINVIRTLPKLNKDGTLFVHPIVGENLLVDAQRIIGLLVKELAGTPIEHIYPNPNNPGASFQERLMQLGKKEPVIAKELIPILFDVKTSWTSASLLNQFVQAFSSPKNPMTVVQVSKTKATTQEEKDEAAKTGRRLPLEQMLDPKDIVTTSFAPVNKTREMIKTNLKSLFFTTNSKTSAFVTTENNIPVILPNQSTIDKINDAALESIEDKLLFLNDLGIIIKDTEYFPEEKLEQVLDSRKLNAIRDNIVSYLNKQLQQSTPSDTNKNPKPSVAIDDIVGFLDVVLKERQFINSLVQLIGEFNPGFITHVFYNAEGKLENEVNMWSGLNILFNYMNDAQSFPTYQSLQDTTGFEFLKDIRVEDNPLLSQVFNKDGSRKIGNQITVENYNGVTYSNSVYQQNWSGSKMKKLIQSDKAITDIRVFTAMNLYPSFQLGDKASYYALRLPSKIADIKNVNIQSKELFELFMPFIRSEIQTVRDFKSGKGNLQQLEKVNNNIKTVTTLPNGEQKITYRFAAFDKILTGDLRDKLLESNQDLNSLLRSNESSITSALTQYFTKLQQKTIAELNEASDVFDVATIGTPVDNKVQQFIKPAIEYIPETQIGEDKLSREATLTNYLVNQFIFNLASTELLFGNMYMHKDPFKRVPGATSTGIIPITDNEVLRKYDELKGVTQRGAYIQLLEKYNMGLRFENQRTSNKTTRFITFKDRVFKSNAIAASTKVFDNKIAAVKQNIKSVSKISDVKERQRLQRQLEAELRDVEQKKSAFIDTFSKTNQSDAFGVMTIDFFKKTQFLTRGWSKQIQEVFDKMVKWDAANKELRLIEGLSSSEQNTQEISALKSELLQVLAENELSAEEAYEFTIQKYQYYGNVENPDFNEVQFHKFELMPLIPQMVNNKVWEKHLDRMLVEDVDYAVFTSGSKLEKDTVDDFYTDSNLNIDTFDTLSSKGVYRPGEDVISTNSYNIRTGYLKNLKEQLKMDLEPHSKSIKFGSQIRALLFNFYDRGKVENSSEAPRISSLFEEYNTIIDDLIKIEEASLIKKAGLSKETIGNETSYRIEDKPKLIAFLKEQAEKKVVNKNVVTKFEMTQEGQLLTSFEASIHRGMLENIMVSVINSRLVDQKMYGEQKVQASSIGFEDYISNRDSSSDTLKFYETEFTREGELVKVRAMQVKVALSGNFVNLLNLRDPRNPSEKIGTLSRLNALLKDESFREANRRALTMIGYRIPTQEHNSVEVMEVQEFLPPVAGSMIVVPSEITAKAGSDFDIDKLNVFMPQIDSEGNYISPRDKKGLEQQIQDISDRISSTLIGKKISGTKQSKKYFDLLAKVKLSSQEIKDIIDYREELRIEIGELQAEIEKNKTPDINTNVMASQFAKLGIAPTETDTTELQEELQAKIEEKRSQYELLEKAIDAKSKSIDALNTQKEIQRQKSAQYKDTIDNLFRERAELRFQLNSNPKKGLQNRIIEIAANVLLHPSNYMDLVTPNSTFLFDDIIADIVSNYYPQYMTNGKLSIDLKGTSFLEPNTSWFIHYLLQSAKDSLGVAATSNKVSQLFRQADLKINNKAFRTFMGVQRDEDKNILMSTSKLSSGATKATAFSQWINLLVDIANDPRAGFLNASLSVVPALFAMYHTGVSEREGLLLSNQPLVRAYTQMQDYVKQGTYITNNVLFSSKDYVAMIIKMLDRYDIQGLPETEKAFKFKDYYDFDKGQLKIFELKDLIAATLGKDPKKFWMEDLFRENSLRASLRQNYKADWLSAVTQLLLLNEFQQFEFLGTQIKKLQDGINYDTSKSLSVAEAQEKIRSYKEMLESQFFINMDRLRFEATTSPFAVQDRILSLGQELFPLFNSDEVNSAIVVVQDSIKGKGKFKKQKQVPRLLRNDLAMYIFQNYQSPAFKEFFRSAYGELLELYEEQGELSPNEIGFKVMQDFYQDRGKLLEQYPELVQQYSFLEMLFTEVSRTNPDFKTTGLIFFEKGTDLENSYIDQIEELSKHPDLFIRRLALKFQLATFYQSGLNFSRFSATRVADVKTIDTLMNLALQDFLSRVPQSELSEEIAQKFLPLFYANNNRMRESKLASPSQNRAQVESDRYKNYELSSYEQEEGAPTVQTQTSIPSSAPNIQAKPENISSRGSEFAKKLTNPYNSVRVTFRGREYKNSEHAYQTWKSGEFNEAVYLEGNKFDKPGVIELRKFAKPRGNNTYEIMVEILTAKLQQNPDLIQGINQRGGLDYIQQSTHNVTGDKFWESKGENKFIEALGEAYKTVTAPTQQPKVGTNVTNVVYTKQTANDKTQGFFFTENLQAYLANRGRGAEIRFDLASSEVKLDVTATNNQAGIRRTNGVRNLNAFAIISKKFQQNGKGNFVQEEGQFQDTQEDFDLFKKYNLEAIEEALNSKLPLNILAAGIATGKAALPLRFAEWLNETLKEKLQVSGTIKENPTKGYKGYGIYDIVSTQQSQAPQEDTGSNNYPVLSKFYEELSAENRAKLVSAGFNNLESLISFMEDNPFEEYTEEDFIASLKCNQLK